MVGKNPLFRRVASDEVRIERARSSDRARRKERVSKASEGWRRAADAGEIRFV